MTTQAGNDWFSAQRQYWDTWFDAQRKTMEEQSRLFGGMQSNWGDLFRQWQGMTCGAQQDTSAFNPLSGNFRQMFCQAGENYIRMMEQFYQASGQAKSPEDAAKDWISTMQKWFEGVMQTSGQPFDPAAQYRAFTESMMHGGPSMWTQALRHPFFPEDKWGSQAAGLFDPFGFYASMPGIGYTREKQEDNSKLYKLFVEYEGQMRRYNMEMSRVGLMALQKFQQYLSNPPEGAEPLESLKAIYGKWVDVSEEVFADYAMSDDYTKLYGDVVNALMAFRKHMQHVQDEMVGQFNLPTRAEVDSLHKRVQELKRDNAILKKVVEELIGGKAAPAANAAKAPAKDVKKTETKRSEGTKK